MVKDRLKGYAAFLAELKDTIHSARIKAALSANRELILLYWNIGQGILQRQQQEGWGAKVIETLSNDLHAEFPDMKCFSRRNLLFMRSFADEFPDIQIVKQLVSQIPWGHIIRIIQSVKDSGQRLWYIQKTLENGWSRSMLNLQIENRLFERQGQAITNFNRTLPDTNSDLAQQSLKDPYIFSFLAADQPRREQELEKGLLRHIEQFLLELGAGFSLVGRQVPLEIANQDYYIDLLFYLLKLRCFVVVELKAVPFEPEFTGKLNFYLSAVDSELRHPDDNPTIGLLLCKSKEKTVVEYALRDMNKPIGVADWHTRLTQSLPDNLKSSLPTVEEIEAELIEDRPNEARNK